MKVYGGQTYVPVSRTVPPLVKVLIEIEPIPASLNGFRIFVTVNEKFVFEAIVLNGKLDTVITPVAATKLH